MNFNVLQKENCFPKIQAESSEIFELLNYLKNDPKYSLDRLNTIIAVDLGLELEQFELIYDLYSTALAQSARVSVFIDRKSPHVPSIVGIFKSAYFDECEIYDMFGIVFDKNPDLKRLFMPKGWKGYPLRKDYKQDDERLAWNDK